MLPDGRRLGAHLPLGFGLVKAVERAHAIGAEALQVFADNPTAWRRRAAPPSEQARFREKLIEYDIGPTAIHASYLINLAGPDETMFGRSVSLLASELRTAPGFLGRFVNVHIGSHRGSGVRAGTRRLADGMALVLAEVDGAVPADEGSADDGSAGVAAAPRIVLENSAGGGFGLGTSIEELADIDETIAARGVARDRYAFCLDAAHAWGAGIDVGDPDATDAFLADFDDRIGLHRLVMLHLNDSRSDLGSRTDRHEHLGAGQIGARGLSHLIRHPALAHAVYYLETPGMDEGYDAVNLARARDLAACRPLPDLPPEAFLVSSTRARTPPPDGPAA